MMRKSYVRDTAIERVRTLLKDLPRHEAHPLDAIRMIDREIGGLLAHPDSPHVKDYRTYASALFPAGLEATRPGKDIILILNQPVAVVQKNGKTHQIRIPLSLKNPEKGVVQIVGRTLAKELFKTRGAVLARLALDEPKWSENITSNNAALKVLEYYDPEGNPLWRLTMFRGSVDPDALPSEEKSCSMK